MKKGLKMTYICIKWQLKNYYFMENRFYKNDHFIENFYVRTLLIAFTLEYFLSKGRELDTRLTKKLINFSKGSSRDAAD